MILRKKMFFTSKIFFVFTNENKSRNDPGKKKKKNPPGKTLFKVMTTGERTISILTWLSGLLYLTCYECYDQMFKNLFSVLQMERVSYRLK